MMRRTALVVLLCIAGLARSARAQSTPPTFEEERQRALDLTKGRMKPVPGTELRRVGVKLLWAAGIATAAAGGLWISVRASADDIRSQSRFTPELRDEFDGASSRRTAMWIALGVGTACGAAGGILYGVGRRREEKTRSGLSVTPLLAPSVAGISIGGRF